MDYVTMGNSGLKVSRACLGTMNFGTSTGLAATDEPEARQIIESSVCVTEFEGDVFSFHVPEVTQAPAKSFDVRRRR